MGFSKIVDRHRYRINSTYGFNNSNTVKIDMHNFDLHRFDADGFIIPLNNLILFNMFNFDIRFISIILTVYHYKLIRLLSKCFLKKLIKSFGKNNLKFSLEDDGRRKSSVYFKNVNQSYLQINLVALWSVFIIEQDYIATISLEYDKRFSNFTTDFSEIKINFYCYSRFVLIDQMHKELSKNVNTYDVLNYKNLNDKYISNYFNSYFDNCIEAIKIFKEIKIH